MYLRLNTAAIVLLFLLTGSLLAQWKPPADNKFTESQLQTYLDTQKDWLDESARILQDATTANSDQAKKTAVGDIGQRYQICLDSHHTTKDEFEWMQRSTAEAFSAVAYVDGSYKTARDRIDSEISQEDDAIAAAQKELAIYQEAKNNGWRILSDDDRAAAVKSAQQDQQAALAEVKRCSDDAATTESDAAQHDADAQSAEDQAANPPADVSADDRAEYIQNKKNEAHAARASAAEARNAEADSKKSEAEAQAQADAAAQRAEHPEIPVTQDDKDAAKADIDSAIARIESELGALNTEKQKILNEEANLEKTAKAMTKGVPAENIALLRKYGDQYQEQIAEAAGTTRASR